MVKIINEEERKEGKGDRGRRKGKREKKERKKKNSFLNKTLFKEDTLVSKSDIKFSGNLVHP